MTDTTKIPEPGPARDRLVAEVVGWEWDAEAEWCWDRFLVRNPSDNDADALAALEAWMARDERHFYDIARSSSEWRVILYRLGERGAFKAASAPTLPAAVTAALLATKGEAS